MACCFSVDKEISLKIIESIIASGKCYNPPVGERCKEYCNLYQHNLVIAEIRFDDEYIDEYMNEYVVENNYETYPHLDKHYDEFIAMCNKGKGYLRGYTVSEIIYLKDITITENKEIKMEAHCTGTHMECDWAWPTFSYNERLQSWILTDKWSSPYGICYTADNVISVLDFYNYLKS